MVNGSVNGDVSCYHGGELVLMVHLVNNEKHGEYSQYECGELVLNGYYYHGIQSGIATKIDLESKRIYEIQYVDGEVKYELLDDNGEQTLIRREDGMVINQSCYLVHNFNNFPQFCEEGYSLKIENGRSTLYYITQTLTNDNLVETRTIERSTDRSQMSVHGEAGQYDGTLYEGEYDEAFTSGLSRCGEGVEFFYHSDGNMHDYKLYASFENDRPKGKGQYVDSDSLCVCNGTWDENGLNTITLFRDEEAIYRGLYSDWKSVYRIDRTLESFDVLPYTVSDITVESGVDIQSEVLNFSSFILARTIHIGKRCFAHVKDFYCFHMPNLKSLEIESDSFSKELNAVPEDDGENRSCIIAYCDSLETICIGTNCFSHYNNLTLKSRDW